MPKYDMALIITVDAPTYDLAKDVIVEFADAVFYSTERDGSPVCCTGVNYYELDNDGQRVVYLHSADEPRTDDIPSAHYLDYIETN